MIIYKLYTTQLFASEHDSETTSSSVLTSEFKWSSGTRAGGTTALTEDNCTLGVQLWFANFASQFLCIEIFQMSFSNLFPFYQCSKMPDSSLGDKMNTYHRWGVKKGPCWAFPGISVILPNGSSPHQGCIIRSILPSGMGARGVSSEHVENMEMFSCSPT